MIGFGITYTNGVMRAYSGTREPEIPPSPDRLLQTLVAAAARNPNPEKAFVAVRSLEGIAPTISITNWQNSKTVKPVIHYGRYVDHGIKPAKSQPGFDVTFGPGTSFVDIPILFTDASECHLTYHYDIEPDEERDRLLSDLAKDICYFGDLTSRARIEFGVTKKPKDGITYAPARLGNEVVRVPARGRVRALRDDYERRIYAIGKFKKDTKGAGIKIWMNKEHDAYVMEVGYTIKDQKELQRTKLIGVFFETQLPWNIINFDIALKAYRQAYLQNIGVGNSFLSGHEYDGSVTKEPHIGFVPIFDAGRAFASGNLLGIGITIPLLSNEKNDKEKQEQALEAIAKTKTIVSPVGTHKIITLQEYRSLYGERSPAERALFRLQKESTTWGTVTPAMLWQHLSNKEKKAKDWERVINQLIERSDLPHVQELTFGPGGLVYGSQHSGIYEHTAGMPPYVHLTMKFTQPVTGPIILGRNAWKGFGLCLPLN